MATTNTPVTKKVELKITATDANGSLAKISNELERLNRTTNKTAKSLKDISSQLQSFQMLGAGIIGAFGVRELAQAIDSFQLLGDRMTTISGSAEEANKNFVVLFGMAQKMNTSTATLAETYNRISIAVGDLGVKSEGVLALTESLYQTFRLSGATIAEATGATIQLSQGLSSGTLRGQELRSVLEANGMLAGMLAKHFKVNRGELIKLAESGKITSKEIFEMLGKGYDELDAKAKMLRPTFEQTIIKTLDLAKLSLKDLNEEFAITTKFASAMKVLANNIGAVTAALIAMASAAAIFKTVGVVMGIIAGTISWIPLAIAGIVTGIGALTAAIYANRKEIALWAQNFSLMDTLANQWQKKKDSWNGVKTIEVSPPKISFEKESEELKGELDNLFDTVIGKDYVQKRGPITLPIRIDTQSPKDALLEAAKAAEEAQKRSLAVDAVYKRTLIDLNMKFKDQLKKGLLPDEYIRQLKKIETVKLNAELDLGRLDGRDYYNKIQKVAELGITPLVDAIEILNKEFSTGSGDIDRYNDSLEALKLEDLNNQLTLGKINLDQFKYKMLEIKAVSGGIMDGIALGVDNYARSIGSLATEIANVVSNAFKRMEDTLFDFIKTGRLEFRKFAQAIMDDLLRVIIRMQIIRPLAEGVGSMMGSGATAGGAKTSSGPTVAGYQAHGGAWDSGIQKFATGGVVASPTMFGMAGNKQGLMGESGPEAIIPLTRIGQDLGVKAVPSNVIVNINNNSNSEVMVEEKTDNNGVKKIEVFIVNKQKESFANGSMDKLMKTRYGLTPKGV
jgi:lambda family phage tail tape measure protein